MTTPRGRMRSRQLRVTMFIALLLLSSLQVLRGEPDAEREPALALLPSPARVLLKLSAVILDHVLLPDGRLVHLVANRRGLEDAAEVLLVELEPAHHGALFDLRERGADGFDLPALLADLDFVARLEQVARDVHPPAVDVDVAVLDELTRLAACDGEAEPVHHVVEAAFEESQH